MKNFTSNLESELNSRLHFISLENHKNIVLAENQNNIIKYTQMALEEVTAQREICKVLDGGEYIFNMRAQKYNVRKLLN